MHWAEELIGRPYRAGGQGPDAFDCWGLVRWVMEHRFGRELPAIPVDASDVRAVLTAFRRHPERRNWSLVTTRAEGDCVLIRQSRHPIHVGVWLAADNGGILHASEGSGVVFQRERDLLMSGWRIEGFYRRNEDAP
jgi:cell wall-associated NlpC family hydrolase